MRHFSQKVSHYVVFKYLSNVGKIKRKRMSIIEDYVKTGNDVNTTKSLY